jgi:hypothetical protein
MSRRDEAREHHAQHPGGWGLNLWTPVFDPLRGRTEEGYGGPARRPAR